MTDPAVARTSLAVTRRVPHSPADVFALVSTPGRHREFDDSGMVGSSASPPITGVDQIFRMDMTWRGDDGAAEEYQTDNTVTVFEQDRALVWVVAGAGEQPLGWSWGYRLAPTADDTTTDVTLVHDWTGITAENKEEYGVPMFGEAELAASLALLERTLNR